jgi:hypothetical protein
MLAAKIDQDLSGFKGWMDKNGFQWIGIQPFS